MSAPLRAEHQRDVDALPTPLRAVLDAELARGNSIAEISHAFPAPPVGACIMLAKPLSTESRASVSSLAYRSRNGSLRSGELTDADGVFWLLEPPIAQEHERAGISLGVDVDAMRAAEVVAPVPAESDADRTTRLVQTLAEGTFYGTLTQALDEIAEFHPPAVMAALFRGLETRDGEVACHLAAMLAFLHGKAESIFDWELRPLFLTLNTDDHTERLAACDALYALIDVDAAHVRALLAVPPT